MFPDLPSTSKLVGPAAIAPTFIFHELVGWLLCSFKIAICIAEVNDGTEVELAVTWSMSPLHPK